MRDKLIPEEKIMAIQEQLSGFIVEHVFDPKGEFYYDGVRITGCPTLEGEGVNRIANRYLS